MSFNNSFTAVTGATYTAAQYNTHTRDNFTAVWVYTTQGDLAYASGATTLSRLGIGSAYQFLQVNAAGDAPVWGGLHFASVYRNTDQSLANATPTVINFDNENTDPQGWHSNVTNNSRITVGVTGHYQLSFSGRYSAVGGTGDYWDVIVFLINGSDSDLGDRRRQTIDANQKKFLVTAPFVPVTAGQYLEVSVEQNAGATRQLQTATFSVLRVG
jgi:hypothetical protein